MFSSGKKRVEIDKKRGPQKKSKKKKKAPEKGGMKAEEMKLPLVRKLKEQQAVEQKRANRTMTRRKKRGRTQTVHPSWVTAHLSVLSSLAVSSASFHFVLPAQSLKCHSGCLGII